MMDLPDVAIVTIGVAGDKVVGRTVIQKLIYFGTVLHLTNAKYRPHYYGPYSSEVAGTLQELTSLGFVDEQVETKETTGYTVSDEWKRYCYRLTEDGQSFLNTVKEECPEDFLNLSQLIDKCKNKSKLNPQILSWAAKVHYIASNDEEKTIGFDEIKSRAESLKWNLNNGQIDKAIDLLEDLKLVKKI
jgi:hypothetical protein